MKIRKLSKEELEQELDPYEEEEITKCTFCYFFESSYCPNLGKVKAYTDYRSIHCNHFFESI